MTPDGTEWTIDRLEVVADGIRLHIAELPFPWLFGSAELVAFVRPEPRSVTA